MKEVVMKVAKNVAPIDVKPGLYRMHKTDGNTVLGMVKKKGGNGSDISPTWIPVTGYDGLLSLIENIEYMEIIEL